jgi:hypothetical protein
MSVPALKLAVLLLVAVVWSSHVHADQVASERQWVNMVDDTGVEVEVDSRDVEKALAQGYFRVRDREENEPQRTYSQNRALRDKTFPIAGFLGSVSGLLVGAVFWPWLFSRILRSIGVKLKASVWAGYGLTVLAAVAITQITGAFELIVPYALLSLVWVLYYLSRGRTV